MKETVSALYDGELESKDMDRMCTRLKDEPDLREAWDTYALIGDALRGMPAGSLPMAFAGRLDAEPTVLAPRAASAPVTPRRATRIALSAAAGLAAVGFVAMMAVPTFQSQTPPPAIALVPQAPSGVTPAPAAVASRPAPEAAPASPAVRDYLLAHHRFSPALAFQGAAPLVRTVTDEQGAGGR
jgi:negative regulator of sigma E activity